MVRGQTFICAEKERSVLPTIEKKWKEREKMRWGGGKEFGSCECRFLLQSSHICNLSCTLKGKGGYKVSFLSEFKAMLYHLYRGLSTLLNTGTFVQLTTSIIGKKMLFDISKIQRINAAKMALFSWSSLIQMQTLRITSFSVSSKYPDIRICAQ